MTNPRDPGVQDEGYLIQKRDEPIRGSAWVTFGVLLILLGVIVLDVLAYQRHKLGPALLLELVLGGFVCIAIGLTRKDAP